MKRFKPLFYVSMILALIGVGIFGAFWQVDAINEPDDITVVEAVGYEDVLETGDMSILVYYDIYYAGTLPVEPASQSFFVNILKNGAPFSAEPALQPYAYNDLGYNRGVCGYYYTAAEVTAYGINTTNLSLTLSGNPLMNWTATIPVENGSISWSTSTPSNVAIGNKILGWALQLQQYWQLELVGSVGTQMYLESAGIDYFSFSVQNIAQICPEIFKYQTRPPEYKTWTATATMFPTLAPSLEPTASAGIFGLTTGALSTGMVGIGIVVFLVVIMMRQPRLGRYAFLLAGVLVIFYTRMNEMVQIWVTVVGVIALFVVGYLIFYEKSAA